MPFTDEERSAWHDAKRAGEVPSDVRLRRDPVTECVICGQPFGLGEGSIWDEASICHACDDD